MPYTEKRFYQTLLSSADAELLKIDYQTALDAQSPGGWNAKALGVAAYIAFVIPVGQEANYIAANQAKKEVMAQICAEAIAAGGDFDTYYNARYTELYP